MKKLLSHMLPFTKEISSKINGTLELTLMNGKKVLDSQNANYSYGSLQKLLSYGLSQIDIPTDSKILLLGLGGGSIIQSLREKFNHTGKTTAVEIDEVIIKIAKNEFDITDSSTLEIICDDAFHYVNHCTKQFEIIIVDIFIDNQVPEPFYTDEFWKATIDLLVPKGKVIFNAGMNLKENTKIKHLQSKFKSQIELISLNKVQGTNTMLIGKKK